MFYTIYDVLLFQMKKKGIEEKELVTILKKNGFKAKQLELLKSNCTTLLPNKLLDKALEIAGLTNLEMNLMLGNVPLEYEDSYLENISRIAKFLSVRELTKDNKNVDVEYRTSKGELYHADCLDVLPMIQSESVDMVFADPPFNLKKEYANGRNDDLSISQYIEWSKLWLDECVRILKPGGSLYIYNIPKWCIYYAEYLCSKICFQNWIAIDMKNSFPIKDKYTPSHYGLLYFTKGTKPKTFNKQRLPIQTCRHCGGEYKDYGGYKDKMNVLGVNIADVWYDIFPVRNGKNRPYNELSIKLLDRIISFSSNEGDLILDPFGGSGTTYAVAELLNRRWIGIELGDCDVIKKRMTSLEKDRNALEKINDEKNVLFTKKKYKVTKEKWFLASEGGKMKVVTFFNNKGGVGKTTTIINLASYLSIYKNKKVLVVDLDPQSNSTQAILPEETWLEFYDPENQNTRKTIYDYFRDMEEGDANFNNIDIPVSESQNSFKISLIPGHPKLSIIDDTMSKSWSETLSGDKGAIRKLNWLNQLKKANSEFDYILIDVGPSLGALNRSALLNSDYFLTPMASDIFSLLGISNIGDWIERWMKLYKSAINTFVDKFGKEESQEFFDKYLINTDVDSTTRYIGYSIQQYSKRKFKNGERPTQAYEKVINNFHAEIEKSLGKFMKDGIASDALKLGDVPYVYSIIPLSQTSNTPIFELSYATGVRGNQSSSVESYKQYLNTIAENFMKNAGEMGNE